ncbi:MAG: hypothetical protein ABR572_07515 [Cryomorphaceae bacterium]|nr:hypothetical protein [Flavobacteriales bacterium]
MNRPVWSSAYQFFLSESTREKGERTIVVIAIASFIIHLTLIALAYLGFISEGKYSDFLGNPIVAIYTPFSFILLYEVYLLVYYIPKSITRYIGKQYEIITLIIIRKIFNDISKLEFTPDWFTVKGDIQFTYDIVASVLLFFLIFVFYYLNKKRRKMVVKTDDEKGKVKNFVRVKQIMAGLLVPLLFVLAIYNFGSWVIASFWDSGGPDALRDVNNIFFEEFFTVLILADVLLLLFSFLYTDEFHQVIRNSGFVISTVLIKLSFGQEGLTGTVLTVIAVVLGVLMLFIHNKYERLGMQRPKD